MRFVLHWKSVRPVPKVTIDFGDGRKVERTITGDSIHYVLDADGRVIDALPGLYGAKAFLALLDETAAVEKGTRKADVELPIVRVVRNFERSIAEDTVRNEYTFHRQIHQWLATGQAGALSVVA